MKRIERRAPAAGLPVDPEGSTGVELPLGCWLVTPRRGFVHHGIYVGDGRVVHYAGLSRSLRRGPVQLVPLADFCRGRGLWMKPASKARYSGLLAVERALSRIGENRYRVTTNNCEHFCTWCLEGEGRSRQIERWLAWPRAAANAVRTAYALALGVATRVVAPGVRSAWTEHVRGIGRSRFASL